MAQALYDSYKQDLLDRATGIDFDTNNMDVIFVTSTYSFSAAHQDFADLTNTVGDGGTARANAEVLSGKSVTNGVADATDPVFASVTGTNINAFVLFWDNTTDADSWLLGYFDSISTFSPSAQQVTIAFDAAGIFYF